GAPPQASKPVDQLRSTPTHTPSWPAPSATGFLPTVMMSVTSSLTGETWGTVPLMPSVAHTSPPLTTTLPRQQLTPILSTILFVVASMRNRSFDASLVNHTAPRPNATEFGGLGVRIELTRPVDGSTRWKFGSEPFDVHTVPSLPTAMTAAACFNGTVLARAPA